MYKGGERYASFIYVFGIMGSVQCEKGGRHNKPHIHAIYGNEEVVVGIDGEVLEGKLPNKQMKLLLVWMAIHEEELYANWQLLSPGDGCFKIEPLRGGIMLRPTAVKVEAVCAYQILVEFDNGEKKYFDVEPYIQGEWYGKLRILEYFKKVTTDGFTVVWPDGQDICPDELYDLGKLVS